MEPRRYSSSRKLLYRNFTNWPSLYFPHSDLEVICCWLFSTDVSSIGEVISTIPSRVGWVQFFRWRFNPDCGFYLLLQIKQRYRVSFMPADTFSVCVSGNTLFVLSHSLWWKFLSKQKNDFCASKFLLQVFAYRTVTVVHLADQTWIHKTVYCIRRVMLCKIDFTNWNPKIAILRASIVVTY